MYFEIIEFERNGSISTKNLVLNSVEEGNIEIPTIKRFLMATLFVDTENLTQIALYLDPVKSKESEYPSITVPTPSKIKKYKFSIAGKYVLTCGIFREYKGTIVIDENLTITKYNLGEDEPEESHCNHRFIEIPYQEAPNIPCIHEQGHGTGDFVPNMSVTTCYNPLDDPVVAKLYERGLDRTSSIGIDHSVEIPHNPSCPFAPIAVNTAHS